MKEKVRSGYEAGDYEGEKRSTREVREHEKELLEKMESMTQGEKVLDLGCGTGEPFDRYLVDHGFDVTGVDLVSKHISSARENVPEGDFQQGDFFSVQENGFDAVVSFYAIFHLERDKHSDLFEFIHEKLSEDGVMLVTVGGGDMEKHESEFAGSELVWSSYSPEKNKEIIRNAGFSIVEIYEEKNEEEHHYWVLAEKA